MELKCANRSDFLYFHASYLHKKQSFLMKRISLICALSLALAILASCDEQRVQSGDKVQSIEVDSTKANILQVSGKLFSIPSPIQTAILIQNSEVEYRREQLAHPEGLERFQVKAAQAMNLGIYGTDMAYASLYEDGQAALKYFKAVDALSRTLGISGALDPNIIKRLSANVENVDSLLILSGKFYQEADNYLKENERFDIAAYILLGGWVEATYLTGIAATEGKQAPVQRLAEQKNSVQTLIDVLVQTADTDFARGEIMTALKALHETYQEVKSTYTYKEPVTDADKKSTTIRSTTVYDMDSDLKNRIVEQVAALRELITA